MYNYIGTISILVCITVSIRVNDGSKTDENPRPKQGDYGPRAEVPSPKEDHPNRTAEEHSEASSECSYSAEARVPDNPRAPSPSDHIYEVCSEHEMKFTLQGDKSKLSTAEILSIKKVTEFLFNKGNQFEMNICDWQYAEESNLHKIDWYHGRIDKEEARRRLDASVVICFFFLYQNIYMFVSINHLPVMTFKWVEGTNECLSIRMLSKP